MRTVLEIAIRAGKSFSEDRCPLFAASITYFSLISLFPLAMFAIGVAGFVLGSEGDQQRIVDELTRALPLSEGKGREDLQSLISSAVDARGALGVVGLLGTAYAGSALFGAVRASLVTVYEKEKRRPLIKAKLLDIAFVLGFTALLMLSVALTFVIALAQRYSVELFGEPAATPISWLLTLAYPTVPAAVSFLVFFLLFTVVASAGLRKADAAWGAVVATAGFEALKVGFAQYVAYFGNYDATYGTIGFLVALLAFFYLGAQVMLIGAEVAESRMLVTLAKPPERFEETDALRARITSTVSWIRRRLGLGAVEATGRANAATAPGPDVNGAGSVHPLAVPGSESDGEHGRESSRRRWGDGFFWGVLFGVIAGIALRRRRGR